MFWFSLEQEFTCTNNHSKEMKTFESYSKTCLQSLRNLTCMESEETLSLKVNFSCKRIDKVHYTFPFLHINHCLAPDRNHIQSQIFTVIICIIRPGFGLRTQNVFYLERH